MSSSNFTTHYSIPLPLGTDLTTPMDYNEAAEAVDTALFAAETDAGNASEAAAAAVTTANAAADAVDTLSGDLSQEKAKIVALQTRVTNAENEIDDVRADSSDMITAYNEPTATASHAYAIGDFFIYNNTLYKATAAIAIGATIVPDTNCETTNVSTELIEIKSALSEQIVARVVADGVKNRAQILAELYNALPDNKERLHFTKFKAGVSMMACTAITATQVVYSKGTTTSSELENDEVILASTTSNSHQYRCAVNSGATTFETLDSAIPTNGTVFAIISKGSY